MQRAVALPPLGTADRMAAADEAGGTSSQGFVFGKRASCDRIPLNRRQMTG